MLRRFAFCDAERLAHHVSYLSVQMAVSHRGIEALSSEDRIREPQGSVRRLPNQAGLLGWWEAEAQLGAEAVEELLNLA
jgi:hypothetical protein